MQTTWECIVVGGGAAGLTAYPSVELLDGETHTTRRVLLATGMEYRLPRLDGVAERWGRSVFHCPFCHGWEVRERPLAVLDAGASGVQRAVLLRAWSDDVTLVSDGPAGVGPEEADRLATMGVAVDERAVAGLRGPGGALTDIAFADGGRRACEGLLVPVTLHQRSALAQQLGARAAEPSALAADAVDVDATFATSAAGVSAAGDLCSAMPSVANAVAAGSNAAAMVVHGLVADGA